MIETVYIEQEIRSHPRVQQILDRVKPAQIIDIERYGEVFNPKSQNFRLQKQNPALILASKHSNFVLPAPPDYTIGSDTNYYFSHMLNCIYDCRYCFLQGMYSSANYFLTQLQTLYRIQHQKLHGIFPGMIATQWHLSR